MSSLHKLTLYCVFYANKGGIRVTLEEPICGPLYNSHKVRKLNVVNLFNFNIFKSLFLLQPYVSCRLGALKRKAMGSPLPRPVS